MTSIKLTVTGAHAWASVTGPLTSGMVGIPVTIEYDEAWDGLTKNLMCRCSPWGSDNGESRAILNVGETAAVAHEVMQADMQLYLGIEGFSGDGQLVMPTIWAGCGKIEYGANTCEDPSADPELPVWNQLQTEMEQLKEYALTQDEIQACAQEAAQAAQEARQAADEAKQAASVGGSGLYYTPVVTQPTGDTLKFEFKPSVTGAPIPNPVTVELPVSEGSDENVDLTGYATEAWVQEGYQPKGDYLTEIPAATTAVLGGVKASVAMSETMTRPVAVDENGGMWTTPAASGTVLVAASDAPDVIRAAAQYVCTGANDQIVINQAIAAVGKGEVRLSGGNYYLTGEIVLADDITLTGKNAILNVCDEISSTITQAYIGGDTVIHVADTSEFLVGQKVSTDAKLASDYPCHIIAIDDDALTVTLDAPLHPKTGFDANLYRLIADFTVLPCIGLTNVVIDGLVLNCNGDSYQFYDTTYGGNGVLFHAATRCTVQNCTVNDAMNHGILTTTSEQCRVLNCVVNNANRLGIDTFSSTDSGGHVIHGCTAKGCNVGIQLHNARNTIVSNCFAIGNLTGISAQEKPDNVLITGCQVLENGYGIKCIAKSGQRVSIIANHIDGYGKGGDAIQIDASANAHNWTVSNNYITRTKANGIYIIGVDGFTVNGNTIDNPNYENKNAEISKAAILITGAATNGLVSGNRIALVSDGTTGCPCGIAEYNLTGDNNVVIGNVIRGARIAATQKVGANSVFDGNYEFD